MARFARIFTVGVVVGIAAISLFSFSKTNQFSINLNQNPETQPGMSLTSRISPMTLDAEALLGSNFTDIFSKTAANFLLALHPEGPEGATSTSAAAKLPIDQIGALVGRELSQRIGQEQKTFSLENLTIVDDSTERTLAYLTALQSMSAEHLEQFRSQDILLLAYAANRQNNTEARKTLVQYLGQSEAALESLMAMPVPRSFATLHVSFMNIVSESHYLALSLLLEKNDPLRSSLAAYAYPALGQKFSEFSQQFAKTLEKKNLTFL